MYCKHCGNQIENVSKFCSFCGAKQELIGQVPQTQQSFSQADIDQNTVKDIDGNIYKTICIGNQIWMAENLRVSKYRNGDPIPNIKNHEEWFELNSGAWCNYDNDISNDSKYGKLYNFYAVDDKRGLAPKGWHVPNEEEWETLITFLGGEDVAGGELKESGVIHWSSPNEGATNKSGFSALPGGYRDYFGPFYRIGNNGIWWRSTENNSSSARYRNLHYSNSNVYKDFSDKAIGYSVRCLKDSDNLSLSKAQQLFSIVLNGVDFIENEPYENGLTVKGRYEVILFNSHIALGEYKNTNPHDFERDFEEYHNILINYAKSLDLGLDKNEMLLFFDSRYKFYYNEMEDLTDGSGTYIPGRIYSAFYLTPLVNEPEMIYDLVVLIPFLKTIVNLVKWIYNEMPKL